MELTSAVAALTTHARVPRGWGDGPSNLRHPHLSTRQRQSASAVLTARTGGQQLRRRAVLGRAARGSCDVVERRPCSLLSRLISSTRLHRSSCCDLICLLRTVSSSVPRES